MSRFCKPGDHVSRRAFMKSVLVTSGGAAVANWGSLVNSQSIAAELQKTGKRCIMIWLGGGASQIDTFDMKVDAPNGGPFRPIQTSLPGLEVCEYMPNIARLADRLCVIRSMSTGDPGHGSATHLMHCGRRNEGIVEYPEIGSMVAKYLGKPGSSLPSFIQFATGGQSGPNSGSGYLGPKYQPFRMSVDRAPAYTTGYLGEEEQQRRRELYQFVHEQFTEDRHADSFQAYQEAKESAWRLMDVRQIFDLDKEWKKAKDLYGDTEFGKRCLLARRFVEEGVPFVEVDNGGGGWDTHGENFDGHKRLIPPMDKGWAGLLIDLEQRGLLKDTLVIWQGEFGRTPNINNRIGRDHYARAWTTVLAGGGVKAGYVHGKTSEDGRTVTDGLVSTGDYFATVFQALGINPRDMNYVGIRPVPVAPDHSKVVQELLI